MMYLSGRNQSYLLWFFTTMYLRDEQGNQTWYEALSVIEYRGKVSPTGESEGHYLCDIKEKIRNVWFRTNDNSFPVPIDRNDVSQKGYVV